MKLFSRSVLLLIAGITASAGVIHADSASGVRERKVDVGASAKSSELARQQTGAGQIAHPRFENIEDAAHAVFVDQPERFNELLKKFVKDLPTTPAPAGSTP